VGDLAKDAGAVACFHIGIDRASVGHVADGSEGVIDDVVGFFALEVCDRAHAAVGGFILKGVEGALRVRCEV